LKSCDARWRHFYRNFARPSIDPELMIRMLLIGYRFGVRSERRLCDEVHLNLAYRWFCRLVWGCPRPLDVLEEQAWVLP
jgi:transposase